MIIPYGRQSVGEDDVQAVVKVLRGDRLTQGPAVAALTFQVAGSMSAKRGVAPT